MKKVLIILGALLALGIAAVVTVFLVAANKFGPMAEKVLVDWKAGKHAEVYAGTAKAFRSETSLKQLEAYLGNRTQGLGEFLRVVKTTGGGVSASTATGTTGTVSNVLEYANGRAKGEFTFLKEDGDWKLLRLQITPDVPEASDRRALEGLGREILKLYDTSSFAEIYGRFSKPLQDAWKRETYDAQIAALREKSGKVEEATLRETKDDPRGGVTTDFDIRFAAGPGNASFRWEWTGRAWTLIGFQLGPTGR